MHTQFQWILFTYLLLQFLVYIKYFLYRADDVGCTLHNIHELKQGLVQVSDGMDQTIIDSAIDEWPSSCLRVGQGWTL